MAATSETTKKKLLLIGWDGADWEHITPMLEQGLLPTLERMINRGVMGNLATLQPVLSPMLWNSAGTGKYAYQHGITGFVEPDPHHGGARPFSSHSRKCKAIWNILSQSGYRTNVINWWASHPAEPVNGCIVSNLFNGVQPDPRNRAFKVAPGTIHPADKTQFYSQFKVYPTELTSEQICPFIPKAEQIDQENDSRLETFAKTLAETLTTHCVATAVMEHEPWDFMAVYYTAIDHFSHAFMPYHPPRLPYVAEKDFEIFKDVVTGAYRFSDMMLERLLQLAGEDTTVILCSDHGFQSREMRPRGMPAEPAGPAIWHRRYGIVVMTGPGIKVDERIYGASLIDITPTILTTLGMPVGADMDGRPLLEAFEEAPLEVETIPSWEQVEGECGMHESESVLPTEDAEDLMKQFVALGYIEDPGDDKEKQNRSAQIESDYNLARNFMYAGKHEEARELLEKLVRENSWETRFVSQLAFCYFQAGYYQQTIGFIESAFDVHQTRNRHIRLIWVDSQLRIGRMDDELFGVLQNIENEEHRNPGILIQIGSLYSRLRRWDDSERLFRNAVTLHDENAEAWQGLANVYRHQGRNQETIDAALTAVGLIHRSPQAHLNLGIALAKSGHVDRSVIAFKTALRFLPGMIPAHRWLATVYRSQLNDPESAALHARLGQEYIKARIQRKPAQKSHTEKRFDIPPLPSEQERREILNKERPRARDPRRSSGKTFIIVSGLPRSGTSLMMQMLEAGGFPPKTDGLREADLDNPRGYYEWEAVKHVASKPEIFYEEELENKAIKVISAMLPKLPYPHNYKVIFMTRPVEEVVASQAKMIARLGTDGVDDDVEELARKLVLHRDQAKTWMNQNDRVEFIEVDYPSLVTNPAEMASLIQEFVGPDRINDAEKMVRVVDANLYRQTKSSLKQ